MDRVVFDREQRVADNRQGLIIDTAHTGLPPSQVWRGGGGEGGGGVWRLHGEVHTMSVFCTDPDRGVALIGWS